MAPTREPPRQQALPPPAGRTLWNSDLIACLLELRLGHLLPQFAGAGGAPGALKDAWKTLQVKFATATNVNLSMLQLKNKYQQLKREYQLTTQLLEERAKREAKRNGRGDGGDGCLHSSGEDDDEEDEEESVDEQPDGPEIVLPQYWDMVQKAFDDVDGNDLHKSSSSGFMPTPPKIRRPAASRDDDETPPTSTDRNTSFISHSSSRRDSVEPDQPSRPQSASAPPPIRSPNGPPALAQRATAPPATSNSNPHFNRSEPSVFQRDPNSQREAPRYFPRPLAPQPADPAHYSTSTVQQKRPMSNAFSSNSAPAAKVQKTDALAQALVTAGNAIASAMIESAKIIAGAGTEAETPSSSGGPTAASESTAVAELAAKMDAQLANQARILAMLEKSFEVNEALLEQLHKKKDNSDDTSSE
ncbi:hypothetical protein Gpo141_00008358 [Globisporangium polare]